VNSHAANPQYTAYPSLHLHESMCTRKCSKLSATSASYSKTEICACIQLIRLDTVTASYRAPNTTIISNINIPQSPKSRLLHGNTGTHGKKNRK
jgi:hypothetical protein